jgi:hypothetical protein
VQLGDHLLFRRPPRLHGPLNNQIDELHLGLAGFASTGDTGLEPLERPGEIFSLVFLRFLRDEAHGLGASVEGATPFRTFGGGEIIVVEVMS